MITFPNNCVVPNMESVGQWTLNTANQAHAAQRIAVEVYASHLTRLWRTSDHIPQLLLDTLWDLGKKRTRGPKDGGSRWLSVNSNFGCRRYSDIQFKLWAGLNGKAHKTWWFAGWYWLQATNHSPTLEGLRSATEVPLRMGQRRKCLEWVIHPEMFLQQSPYAVNWAFSSCSAWLGMQITAFVIKKRGLVWTLIWIKRPLILDILWEVIAAYDP